MSSTTTTYVEEVGSIGPPLPPHLMARQQGVEESKGSDDDSDDDLLIEEVAPRKQHKPTVVPSGFLNNKRQQQQPEEESSDDSDDDLLIEEVAPRKQTVVPSGFLNNKRQQKPVDSDSDDGDDILIEEIKEPLKQQQQQQPEEDSDDDSNDDILIEEVKRPVVTQSEEHEKTSIDSDEDDSDDDDIVIEEVATAVAAASSHRDSEEDDDSDDDGIEITELVGGACSDDDDDDSEEDEMPRVEEVAVPRKRGGLRTGFLQKKKKMVGLPSLEELSRLKEEKRALGNAAFGKKRYASAVELYSEAIELDPFDAALYANRSAALLELSKWQSALADAQEALRIQPTFVKAFFRAGRAALLMEKFDLASELLQKGLDLDPNSKALREEHSKVKRARRSFKKTKATKAEMHELCAEMTPEERRWKAWWAGQGHPNVINNANLERYVPDCAVDVSYDADVSRELKGPDNLPRLDSDDEFEEDEDDELLEDVLTKCGAPVSMIADFEEEGMGPRSFLTCARLPQLQERLGNWLSDSSLLRRARALAQNQARDCLAASWDGDSVLSFPKAKRGLGADYHHFSWRQRVKEIELRILLPPGTSARDLKVDLHPRRISVQLVGRKKRFWPYERNQWTRIVDVGPQLPPESTKEAGPVYDEDDDFGGLDEITATRAPALSDAFQAAKQRTKEAERAAQAFKEHDDDDDLLVEELSIGDDDDEPLVEELFINDDDDDDEPLVEELSIGDDDEPLVEELSIGDDDDDEPLVEELSIGDDEEPLVEELSINDDDDEPLVEELSVTDDVEEQLPVVVEEAMLTCTVRVRWEEGGLCLRVFEVELPAASTAKDLALALERLSTVPVDSQLLKINGLIFKPTRLIGTFNGILVTMSEEEEEARDDASSPPPEELVLLDHATAHKILVDESIWHISKPKSCKGLALQAPILVIQLAKFGDFKRGTASDAARMWWPQLFVGASEVDWGLQKPPEDFFKWKQ